MEPACLGDETIAALLEGRLAGALGDTTRAHLAGCADCRRLVAATVAALPVASTAAPVARGTEPFSDGPTEAPPGTLIAGKYRIERALGQGGMGHVLVARQLGLDRLVAIKLLQPELARDPLALQRFQREAKLVAALHSEHVVRVHDFGEGPSGEPYLVMELLEGEDLAAVVARGPVAPARALAWIRAATEAVAEAHALGIVHRDLKPSNLFLTRAGRIKVLDFGLAKLAPAGVQPQNHSRPGGAMTHTGMILGSPHYMAPEQILGARNADARSDVWSLGATLFHLLRGFPPFAQNTLDSVFASILSGWLPPLDDLPPPLAAIIRRAMAQAPAARFASAAELLHALDGVALEPTQSAPGTPVRRPLMARRVVLVGAGLAVAGAAAAAIVWSQRELAAPLTTAPAPPPAITEQAPQPAPTQPSAVEEAVPKTGSVPASAGAATSLDNLDEARLRRRLANLGWKITMTAHDSFPGCEHTRLMAEREGAPTADVFLLDCRSASIAASELARLRRGFPRAWFSLDEARLLVVVRDEERLSRALAEALQEP